MTKGSLTRRVSSCSFENGSPSRDVETGSVASIHSRSSRREAASVSASVSSKRDPASVATAASQKSTKKDCSLLYKVYVFLFIIQALYLIDMRLKRFDGEYGETKQEKLPPYPISLPHKQKIPWLVNKLEHSYGYFSNEVPKPFPGACKRLANGGAGVLVWAYDEPPDMERFKTSLNSFPQDTMVHVYCGSTTCIERATIVSNKLNSQCTRITRMNVIELAQQSPLQNWVEHNVLAKLLAAHNYEDHLQVAMQLVALWKHGGTLLQPGVEIENTTMDSATEYVGTCDGSIALTSAGLWSMVAPKKSETLEKLMGAFLNSYSWQKEINARYSKDAWPLRINLDSLRPESLEARPMPAGCSSQKFSDGRPEPRYFATLSYDERRKYLLSRNNTGMNVGDETQGLAGIQMIPRVDAFVERDRLDMVRFSDEPNRIQVHSNESNPTDGQPIRKIHAFLNAWWGTRGMVWPPPNNIEPITLAMHFQPQIQDQILEVGNPLAVVEKPKVAHRSEMKKKFDEAFLRMKIFLSPLLGEPYVPPLVDPNPKAPFLKSHEPVGARDTKTLAFLRSNGVNAIFTACMTMTLSLPPVERGDKVLIVDAPKMATLKKIVPEHLLKNATFLTQKLLGDQAGDNMLRYTLAFERLAMYAEAKLVITGRLHVGLPAVALGTPVIFTHSAHLPGGGGSRLDGLDDFMHVWREETGLSEDFDWTHPPPNPKRAEFMQYMSRIKQLATCHSGISDSTRKFGMMPSNWGVGEESLVCSDASASSSVERNAIRIATTIDANFFDLVFPSWVNSLAQSNPGPLVLYILTVDLSPKQRCLLRLVVFKLLPSASVYTIPVDVDMFQENYQTKNVHVPIVTQSRLRLPSLLPCVDKVLWIDLDAFAVGPLRALWNQKVAPCGVNARSSKAKYMNGYALGTSKWNNKYGDSFNAGVMLLDLEKLRQNKFEENVVRYWAMERGYNDQVTFNMACNATHGALNQTMNVFQGYSDPNHTPPRQGWIVAHFQSSRKPWSDRFDRNQTPFADIWDESKITFEEVLDI